MILLKNILSEKISDVQWLDKAYNFAYTNKFPLTPTISNIIYNTERVRAFHITSPSEEYINKMASIRGSKKSISCMSRVPNNVIRGLKGVWQDGAMYYVEGDIVLKAAKDILSSPDEQGRRWFYIGVYDDTQSIKLNNKFLKLIRGDKERMGYLDKIFKTDGKERNITLQKFIKRHIDLAEKFAKENAEEIKSTVIGSTTYGAYDEILLNKVKLIDVIWDKSYKESTPDPSFVKKTQNKLKSIVSGKVITVDSQNEDISSKVESFVKSRKGKFSGI
jgi:hypothetical protein